jgi:hypothetical protein
MHRARIIHEERSERLKGQYELRPRADACESNLANIFFGEDKDSHAPHADDNKE